MIRTIKTVTLLLIVVIFIKVDTRAQGLWKRVHGDGITEVPSAEGTYSPTNSPYSRYAAACMVDTSNTFWLYGAGSNDLWRFNSVINQWMLADGEYGGVAVDAVYGTMGVPDIMNTPGSATFGHPSWGDHEGNLWLYGINGLNDLWKYDISAGMWTWVKGTSSPGPAIFGVKGTPGLDVNPGTCNETDCHWTDSDGKLWLYTEFDGNLWVFDIDTEMWTWVSGEGSSSPDPIYGVLDEFGPGNTPGGFSACPAVGTLYSMWITSDDHLWMLVNRFEADLQTEVWEFDPVLTQWRCRRIDLSDFGATQVHPAGCTQNEIIYPIARSEMRVDWVDDCDRLYMFGGMNFCTGTQAYNDVWMYDPTTNNYTYLQGTIGPMVPGIQGVFDPTNIPGPTAGGQAWQNETGFYMMGGQNALGSDIGNSVWMYVPDTVQANFSHETDCYNVSFTNLSETGCNNFKAFHWEFGDGTISDLENPEHAFPSNGTYEVLLVATNCSWHSDSIVYSIDITCEFDIEVLSDTICEGDCYDLIATSAEDTDVITFEWNNDITDDNDSVLVCPTETTSYQVIATNIDGSTDTAVAIISVIPEPNVDLGTDTGICSGPYLLDAGNPGATHIWNDGSTDQLFTVTEPGMYSVEVSFGSCIVEDSIAVTFTAPDLDLGPDLTVCSVDTLLNAGAGLGYTYLWQDGFDEQYYSVNDTGTYYVSVSDEFGCSVTDTLFISAGTLNIDLGMDTVFCNAFSIVLDAGYSEGLFLWTDGSIEQYLTVSDSGTYAVSVLDGYCMDTDTINIGLLNITANFSVDDTVGCRPLLVSFNDLSESSDITDWFWTFGDGTTANIQNPVHEYVNTDTYEINLQITDVYGCSSDTLQSVFIEVYPQPEAAFSFNPTVPEVNLEVMFTDESIGALTWNWTFGDGEGSSEQNPEHTYTELSNFFVTLSVSNNFCHDSTSKNIVVTEDLIFYVPNVFTPDGNLYNDTFFPVFTSGYDPYDYHLTIFNRWGEIVFESFDSSIGWDGTYSSCGIVQDGVYIWQIEVGLKSSDEQRMYNGHVTVLK